MALRIEDAISQERRATKSGAYYYIYFFKCIECGQSISSQHNYFKRHSGKCGSCVQKGKPFISAYNTLRSNYKRRNILVELTYEEFFELCKISNCHYCNSPILRTTKKGVKGYRGYFIDRMDNNKPYRKDNCVPCCWDCNQFKGDRLTYKEFVAVRALLTEMRKIPLDKITEGDIMDTECEGGICPIK